WWTCRRRRWRRRGCAPAASRRRGRTHPSRSGAAWRRIVFPNGTSRPDGAKLAAAMEVLFFVVAVLGFLVAANANQPIPVRMVGVPSFFGGWLVSELAPHHLVAHVIVAALLIALG